MQFRSHRESAPPRGPLGKGWASGAGDWPSRASEQHAPCSLTELSLRSPLDGNYKLFTYLIIIIFLLIKGTNIFKSPSFIISEVDKVKTNFYNYFKWHFFSLLLWTFFEEKEGKMKIKLSIFLKIPGDLWHQCKLSSILHEHNMAHWLQWTPATPGCYLAFSYTDGRERSYGICFQLVSELNYPQHSASWLCCFQDLALLWDCTTLSELQISSNGTVRFLFSFMSP